MSGGQRHHDGGWQAAGAVVLTLRHRSKERKGHRNDEVIVISGNHFSITGIRKRKRGRGGGREKDDRQKNIIGGIIEEKEIKTERQERERGNLFLV